MTDRELGNLFARAIQLLIARSQISDAEHVSIAELHEEWSPTKTYGSNEFLRYGVAANGRAQLWRTLRTVPVGAPAPGQPANPANFSKV